MVIWRQAISSATADPLIPIAKFTPLFTPPPHRFSLIFPLTAPNGDGSGPAKNSPWLTAPPCRLEQQHIYIQKGTNRKWQFPFVCYKQWKRQTSVCFLQKETENENLFSLVNKQ